MTKRPRIKSPIFTAKTDGQVIRRTSVQFSTTNRIKQILTELGGDPKQVMADVRWQILCRKASLL